MAKAVSMKDVIKCLNYLGHEGINEIHLLPRYQDDIVKPVLHELGIDINKGFYIKAQKHRTLDNDIHLGYRYYGTIRSDREWANSKACDVMERIAITSFTDISLTKELCNLVGRNVDLSEAQGSFPMLDTEIIHDLVVETYEADSRLIKQLDEICKNVRGDE